jgi:hypothetical protein
MDDAFVSSYPSALLFNHRLLISIVNKIDSSKRYGLRELSHMRNS